MSIASSLQVIYQTCKKGELEKARYLVDLVMEEVPEISSDAIQDLSGLVADLAQALREDKRIDDAIGEMRRSLALKDNATNRAILEFWKPSIKEGEPVPLCPHCGRTLPAPVPEGCPACHRLVRRCEMCGHVNRIQDSYCRRCGAKSRSAPPEPPPNRSPAPGWFFPFPHPIATMAAPPAALGDLVVFAPPMSGQLLALKIENGDLVWQGQDLYAGTHYPRLVCVHPFIYVFADRVVLRLTEVGSGLEVEPVYCNEDFQPDSRSATALADGTDSTVFFATGRSLLVHPLFQRHPAVVTADLAADDSFHPPVAMGKRIYLLSKKGRLFRYVLNPGPALEAVLQVPDCAMCGAPGRFKDRIVFEAIRGDVRQISVWDPNRPFRNPLSADLEDAACSAEDSHFLQRPLSHREGVVLVGDEPSTLHFARLTGDAPETSTRHVVLSTGPIRVSNIEPLLSAANESQFFSWIPSGFFWAQLDDPTLGGIEFFGSDMVAPPAVFGTRLLLTCQDGIRCYAL
jgi:hypothetical protein